MARETPEQRKQREAEEAARRAAENELAQIRLREARDAEAARERARQEEINRVHEEALEEEGRNQQQRAQQGGSTFGSKILSPFRAVGRGVGYVGDKIGKGHGYVHELMGAYSPLILLLPIGLLLLDFLTGFNGICIKGNSGTECQFFSWDFLNFIVQFILGGAYWIVVIFLLIFVVKDVQNWKEFVYKLAYYTLLAVLAFGALLFGGMSPMILLHLAFAAFAYIYILKGFSKGQGITQSHWFFLALFFADMFFFPAVYGLNRFSTNLPILEIISSRLLLPIWFFYLLGYVREGLGRSIIVFFVISFYVGYVGFYMYPYVRTQLAELPQEQKQQFINAPFQAMGNYWLGIKAAIENRLDIATGGLYRGYVEKNQYESLGAYFSNIRASEPKFYNDESVTIWGSIIGKTYQDPIIVNFKCYRWKTGLGQQNRIASKTYEPKDPFHVFQLEQNDVECTFPGKELDVGYNTITFSAEYNFATNSYKKAYFMDKDRYRALVKENIDPFKEFGIQDKSPKAIFTNGPIEIGIDIQPLTPISSSYVVYPTIGISLLNRQQIEDKNKKIITRWEGKIKNITELVILMPPGVEIPNIGQCDKESFGNGNCPCNRPFKTYTPDACRESCTSQVLEPCRKACEFYKDPAAKDKCGSDCFSTAQNCDNECINFFGASEEGSANGDYNGYALDVESLQYKNEYQNIGSDRHRTFVCRIQPTPQVLDNTPITTRYFRVRARYNYVLENSVKVNVEQTRAPAVPITYVPSNTDIDIYLKSVNSPLNGLGQCIKDTEKRTGIPAIVTEGVAILESNNGKSNLAQQSKNLFGIKCTKNYIDDQCVFSNKQDCCAAYDKSKLDVQYEPSASNVYRQYPDWCLSVNDFANLISTSNIYTEAMQNINSPETMVTKIGQAGYATDPDWANKVINVMRQAQTQIAKINAESSGGKDVPPTI